MDLMIYALIACVLVVYVVGMLVGYFIGRNSKVDDAMKAARAEIAKMQGERLQRAEKRLEESLERLQQR